MSETKKQHQYKIVNVTLKEGDTTQLHYNNATIGLDTSTNSYIIECICELPLSDEENSEKGYFTLVERIPVSNVLRMYTLDDCK